MQDLAVGGLFMAYASGTFYRIKSAGMDAAHGGGRDRGAMDAEGCGG
jgi:hypothetical protein